MHNETRYRTTLRDQQELQFMQIFRRHEHRLHALALKLVKSESHAQDIIQDVFIKLWEQRDEMDQLRNPEAWLYRLTENRVIDFLRKAAADERLRTHIWESIPPQNSQSTAAIVESREYHHMLQKAIDRLPPQRKLIYCLNREEGLNYQEIATELRISRHTVKNQLSTALQTIRTFLTRTAGPLAIFFSLFF